MGSEPTVTLTEGEFVGAVCAELLERFSGTEFEGLLRLEAGHAAACAFRRAVNARHQKSTALPIDQTL
jgi:hypothetical protein